jgi:hypothetical protein
MTSSARRPGERCGAHRGLEAGLDAAGVIVDDGQAGPRRSGFVGRAAAEGLRAPRHRGSTRGDPTKVLRGLGRFGDHRR